MKKVYLLSTLGLYILLLAASCNTTPGTGSEVNTDPTGISALELRLRSDGDLEWQISGEQGLYVFRLGNLLRYFPQDQNAPYFLTRGAPFYALSPSGTFHVYLKRKRDGKWVHAWLEYTFTFREDGTGSLTTSPMRREAVAREEDLPFYLGQVRTPRGEEWSGVPRLKDPPLSPLTLLNPTCLQGSSWPFGNRKYAPTNTHPSFPPVAPATPPAMYTAAYNHGFGFALIRYAQGRYTIAMDAQNSYSLSYAFHSAYAPTQEEGSLEVRTVIYTVRWDPYHPLDRRWVRIYPREPMRMRWEGGRLVCEDTGGYQVELMPENFSFPGYNYDTGVFQMNKGVPMVLPPELDPYSGR